MKSMTLDYTKLEFNINRTGGFTFPLAMSIWKTQYKTFDNFERTLRGIGKRFFFVGGVIDVSETNHRLSDALYVAGKGWV